MSNKTYKREVSGAALITLFVMAFMGMDEMVGILAIPVFAFATAMFGAAFVDKQTNMGK